MIFVTKIVKTRFFKIKNFFFDDKITSSILKKYIKFEVSKIFDVEVICCIIIKI